MPQHITTSTFRQKEHIVQTFIDEIQKARTLDELTAVVREARTSLSQYEMNIVFVAASRKWHELTHD